jgi:hypothetical protein
MEVNARTLILLRKMSEMACQSMITGSYPINSEICETHPKTTLVGGEAQDV